MSSNAPLASASTSPRVLTPSQAAVVALTPAAASLPATSSPKARSRSGSVVPVQPFEGVRVTKKLRRNGHRQYVAAVYLQCSEARRRLSECVYMASAASKLPPDAMHALILAEREPNYTVEHRFSEFRELRSSITALVRANGVHAKSCAGCQNLVRVLLKHQNWTVKRLFGSREQRFALLTAFLNDLLTLTAGTGKRTTSEGITEEMDVVDREVVISRTLRRQFFSLP